MKYMSSRDIAGMVERRISYKTKQQDVARQLGISQSYLSDFLSGNKEAGPAILKALGFDVTPRYKKVSDMGKPLDNVGAK